MKHIRMFTEGKEVIHYEGIIDETTLCGTMPEEDERYPEFTNEFVAKRVNCEDCKRVRDHVLGKKK